MLYAARWQFTVISTIIFFLNATVEDEHKKNIHLYIRTR